MCSIGAWIAQVRYAGKTRRFFLLPKIPSHVPPNTHTADEFNCDTKEVWTDEKKWWCCMKYQKGCGVSLGAGHICDMGTSIHGTFQNLVLVWNVMVYHCYQYVQMVWHGLHWLQGMVFVGVQVTAGCAASFC